MGIFIHSEAKAYWKAGQNEAKSYFHQACEYNDCHKCRSIATDWSGVVYSNVVSGTLMNLVFVNLKYGCKGLQICRYCFSFEGQNIPVN